MKRHDIKTVIIDHVEYQYFYTVENVYKNGDFKYHVFIMDPESPVIYDVIIKTYVTLLPYRVKAFIENTIGVTVPF